MIESDRDWYVSRTCCNRDVPDVERVLEGRVGQARGNVRQRGTYHLPGLAVVGRYDHRGAEGRELPVGQLEEAGRASARFVRRRRPSARSARCQRF